MAAKTDVVSSGYRTVLEWAAHNDIDRLFADTLALRMMRMLEAAAPHPYFPCVIKHGPSIEKVKENIVHELLADREVLEFTIEFGMRTAKIQTFIESAELLMPRYGGLWLLGGTICARTDLPVDERPSENQSIFFAKGYDGRACAGGVVYPTPWMKERLCRPLPVVV